MNVNLPRQAAGAVAALANRAAQAALQKSRVPEVAPPSSRPGAARSTNRSKSPAADARPLHTEFYFRE